jgi:hypothetical protein
MAEETVDGLMEDKKALGMAGSVEVGAQLTAIGTDMVGTTDSEVSNMVNKE